MPPNAVLLVVLVVLISACSQLPSKGNDSILSTSPHDHAVAAKTPAPLPPVPPLPRIVPRDNPPLAATGTDNDSEEQTASAAKEPAPPESIWDRIRRGFALPPLDNPRVHEWERWYASRPDYVARMIDRSSRYLYYVMNGVERRHMPSEIALLPMIESAYNPQALSKSHASGIWQFIPQTGKLYGLRQNWWYDGRRDIIAATRAALDYLQNLYGMFGSWDLALAAYNWGEGAVARAVAHNQARGRPTDYESLSMPSETRAYVPKLIAVKNIIMDPERFGLHLADVPNKPYFATLPVEQHIDVKLAAKFAHMSLAEFKFLNPAHNKPVIKSDGTETIVLPRDKVAVFLANLKSYDEPLVSWQAHTVKRGEHVDKIAARYGMTVAELKHLNGLPIRRKIRPGEPLLVPVLGDAKPHLPDLPAARVARSKAVKAVRYVSRRAAHKHTHARAATKHKVKFAKRSAKRRHIARRRHHARRVKVVLRRKHAPARAKTVMRARGKHEPVAEASASSATNVMVAQGVQ